jgi:hypothetical protein
MDITGFRNSAAYGRASGLMQTMYGEPKRKGRQSGGSPATRAVLALLFLLALWGAISRLRHTGKAAATGNDTAAAAKGGTGAGGATTPPAKPDNAQAASEARRDALLASRVERAMRLTPVYRGPGKIETFPQFGNANRLLLATHGRLMWYRYDTDTVQVLHEGEVGAVGWNRSHTAFFSGPWRVVGSSGRCCWLIGHQTPKLAPGTSMLFARHALLHQLRFCRLGAAGRVLRRLPRRGARHSR